MDPASTQRFTSSATSINQVPATFKRVQLPRGTNLDYGGGKYDTGSAYLANQGIINLIYDPYNRDSFHNLVARTKVFLQGGANSVTVNNVLNVIDTDEAMLDVVRQAAAAAAPGASVWFLVHPGDTTGIAKETTKGWQRNQKPQFYEPVLCAYFEQVQRKSNLFECKTPTVSLENHLFTRERIMHDALVLAKSLGIPLPAAGYGVGKLIGGCLYVHRRAKDVIPLEVLALEKHLPDGFSWEVVKWEKKTGAVSFIASPDFDSSDEPISGAAWKITPEADGRVTSHLTKQKADPQIYHHKWSFYRDDGSDAWLLSLLRSIWWTVNYPHIDKRRIGIQSFWQAVIEPVEPVQCIAKQGET